jgi:Helix-turn-helix domain
MSIRYVAAVLDRLEHLSAPESLVLIALADFASDDTRECWPSVATIMRRSRLSRRGVQQILRRLEAAQLIETAYGGNEYGKSATSCYRLKFTYDGERLEIVEPKLSPRVHTVRADLLTRAHPEAPRAHGMRPKGAPGAPNPSLNRHRSKERLINAENVDKSKKADKQSLVDLHESLRRRYHSDDPDSPDYTHDPDKPA